ncbi:haloacid dehalogenase type II [Roseicyclus persicicus]|uniref:(S)-2-haloacid dehalogenase n=1 Tax=Roseicyclus persicicus TaxID=2650661 RepID=A0A7X6H1Q2_9RHOB|nr:haloacid dehalogenase type II [Roseibacterium persicicum]NKX46325.1 haloacid dehalogenase type II [Roseibacterium persicicum]
MTRITACVFDAYGTLFDVSAAARALAAEPGREGFAAVWQQVAADWRAKQLEYSWLRAVTGDYCDFWQLTEDGLDWALARAGLADAGLRAALLDLYWHLAAYPEVPAVLARLKAAGLTCAILSNGSPRMLDAAVASAGIAPHLDAVLSVADVGTFKPDARVYDLVGARLGTARDAVLFVSSNGWDVCSAAAYGFRTLWVNRAGLPVDRLPGQPDHVAADLTAVPALLEI